MLNQDGSLNQQDLSPLQQQMAQLADTLKRHKHEGGQTVALNYGSRDILMSFETGEQATVPVYFPFAAIVTRIRGVVVKALAGTDSGTITATNQNGSASAVLTSLASAAINTLYTVQVAANNIVGKDTFYKLQAAKTTAGGRILISVEFRRFNP